MNRPIIAITCRTLVQQKDSRPAQAVPASYIDAVVAYGGVPLLIPSILEESAVYEALAVCSGLLLPGGEDVTPALYGEEPHPKLGSTDTARDGTESAAIRCMHSRRLPILGICRGAQILNVSRGGTLYQDLADQLPTKPPHRDSQWEELSHQLTIDPTTKLYEVIGTEKIGANSLHHQAVKGLGMGLRVSALAPDGVIEGIEDTSHPFCLGVQCHPEVLWKSVETRWGLLFRAFVERCANSAVQP